MEIDNKYYLQMTEAREYLVVQHGIEFTVAKFRTMVNKYNISSSLIKGRRYFLIEDIDAYVRSKIYADRYKKAITLVFANHKGGVGKTVTVYNLAMAMALNKLKVLVVDFDPQANLTDSYSGLNIKNTITDVLMDRCKIEEAVTQYDKYINIIASDNSLSQYERQPQEYLLDTNILKQKLEPLKEHYDLILIDTPPQFSLVNSTGIKASDILFIPLTADYYAISGMGRFIEYAQTENPNIINGGIFLTKHNSSKILDSSVLEMLKDTYSDIILNTKIRETTAIAQAIISQKTIFEYIKYSHGIIDYKHLATEILKITDRYYNG